MTRRHQGLRWLLAASALLVAGGCGEGGPEATPDAGTGPETPLNPCLAAPDAGARGPDAFADRVVAFAPGAGAGYGQDRCPDVVLSSPEGNGSGMGSLHVLSLGERGSITLELTDTVVVDGPGVDLLVFENPFQRSGAEMFVETAAVAVSADGQTWSELSCAASDASGGYPGCAGVRPVFASSTNGVSATDPAVAGGDGFDLAAFPGAPTKARFVRITDSGANTYGAPSGGFDMDAIAVVNGGAP